MTPLKQTKFNKKQRGIRTMSQNVTIKGSNNHYFIIPKHYLSTT